MIKHRIHLWVSPGIFKQYFICSICSYLLTITTVYLSYCILLFPLVMVSVTISRLPAAPRGFLKVLLLVNEHNLVGNPQKLSRPPLLQGHRWTLMDSTGRCCIVYWLHYDLALSMGDYSVWALLKLCVVFIPPTLGSFFGVGKKEQNIHIMHDFLSSVSKSVYVLHHPS